MNRLQEIADKLSEYIDIHFGGDEGNPFYRGWKNGVYQAFEAIKPEIELMLKDQAKMVKDAAIGKIENLVDRSREDGFNVSESDRKAVLIFSRVCATIKSNLDDLQHDWVKLEEK